MSYSQLINLKLGVDIYDEKFKDELILVPYTKKQIKKLMIDDLISEDSKPTLRLIKFIREILADRINSIMTEWALLMPIELANTMIRGWHRNALDGLN